MVVRNLQTRRLRLQGETRWRGSWMKCSSDLRREKAGDDARLQRQMGNHRQCWPADIWSLSGCQYCSRITVNLCRSEQSMRSCCMQQACVKKRAQLALRSCESSSAFLIFWIHLFLLLWEIQGCHVFRDTLTQPFFPDWERKMTRAHSHCGIHLLCAFHRVHVAVLHFAYFCRALLTAVWLSTS